MRIEPLQLHHLGDVRRLYRMLIEENPMTYPAFDAQELDNFVLAVVQNLTQRPHAFRGWVAIVGRKVVGFLAGDLGERAVGRPLRYGNAMWMYVHPLHRSKGLGYQLIQAGVAWFTDEGITHVELFARHGDTQWEERGWTPYLTRYVAPIEHVRQLLSTPRSVRDVG